MTRILWLLLVLLLSLSGCKGEEKRSEEPAVTAENEQETAGTASDSSPESAVRLEILPEKPTAATDLQLLVRGADDSAPVVWRRNGGLIAGVDGRRLISGSFVRNDRITATLEIDGAEFSEEVVIGNTQPQVLGLSLVEAPGAGKDMVLSPRTEDIDGDEVELSYRWSINDEPVDQIEDERLPGDLLHKNDRIGLEILPFDGVEEGPLFRTEPLVVPNSPPTITSVPPDQLQGQVFLYQVQAFDPDADPVEYSLDQGPDGMTLDAAGLLQWTLPENAAGEHAVAVRVTDAEGAYVVQQFNLTVGAPVAE